MKNNKKMILKTKDEKRRLAFEKRNVKKEMNLARYGAEGGTALVMAKTGDFNRRFVAAFLALVFAISTMVLGLNFATKAEEPASTPDPADYLEVNKTISANADGTYNINLEAYAKGEISDIAVTEKIPTDFIIIVDQSGSMATTDMPASQDSYTKVTSTTYPNLETVAEGRYYYLDETTGQYYRVYGKHGYLYYKYPANTCYADDFYGTSLFYYFSNTMTTASGANGYYYYNTEDKAWYPISMAVEGHLFGEQSMMLYECRFSYDRNGTQVALPYDSSRNYHAYRQFLWDRIDDGSDMIVYDFYRRYIGYNGLFYRDIDGVEHAVPTVTGETTTNYCTSDGANAVTSVNGSQQMRYDNLYTLKSGSSYVKTRLEALTQALNEFSTAVAAETDTFGAVDNKVAIVGFSSEGYKNTEILTGSDIGYSNNGSSFSEGSYYFPYKGQNYDNAITGSNGATNYTGPQYYNESGTGIVRINNTHYKNALIAANNGTAGTVNPDLTKAIKSIGAYGGTKPADGFDMAANIIQQRTAKEYTLRSGEHKGDSVNRNVIVIYFTDGRPGNNSEVDQYAEANLVVNKAKAVKELGASVFSIGVFGESDANPLTYSEYDSYTSEDDSDAHLYRLDFVRRSKLIKSESYGFLGRNTRYYHNYYYRYWISGQQTAYGDTPNDTIYDYMSVTSSNYPSARYFMDSNWNSSSESWKTMTDRVRGTAPQKNDYYRMASNQDTLVEAFKAAVTMNNTETEKSTTTINETAILRDVITDNFNTNIVTDPTDSANHVTSGVTVQTFPCTGFNDEGEPVFSDNGELVDNLDITYDSGTRTLDVSGFDYGSNYSAKGSTSSDDVRGKKLVVTIEGVVPKATVTGDIIYTNDSSSGIYTETPTDKLVEAFPKPAIARYKYELNVGSVDTNALLDIDYALQSNGTPTSSEAVVLRGANVAGRSDSLTDGIFSTTNKNQNATIYAEYITKSGLDSSGAAITANPSDFSLNALVKLRQDSPDKDKFTFYLDTEDFTAPHDNPAKLLLAQGNNEGLNGNQNGILYVRSEANNRTVTINETVSGNFANAADTFTPVVYLTPTDDSEVNASETFDGVAWIRDGNNNRLRLVTPLGELRGNGTDSHNVSVPAGWKLIVEQTDDNNYVPSTPSVIKTGTTDSVAYENGVVVSDDLTITIDNVRNTIPIEGMADENGSDKTIVFVLTGVAVLSAGAGVAYVYRKKDEFNEQ